MEDKTPWYKQPVVWLGGIVAWLILQPRDGEAAPPEEPAASMLTRTYTVEGGEK